MNYYIRNYSRIIWRLIASIPLVWFIWLVITKPLGGFGLLAYFIPGVVVLLWTAIIWARPIASLVAEPTGDLFFPGRKLEGPQPMYGVPESKRKQGLSQEAFDDYQKISEEFPQELKPYVGMMDIAVVDLKNKDLADSVHQHGLRNLKREEDQTTLTRLHKTIVSRHKKPKKNRPISIRNTNS